ncbi:MAG: hypothetical protein Alpg2KO_23170 [Alphaproteobacteria bacterium]
MNAMNAQTDSQPQAADFVKMSKQEISQLVELMTQAELDGDVGEIERLSALLDAIHRARVAAGVEADD